MLRKLFNRIFRRTPVSIDVPEQNTCPLAFLRRAALIDLLRDRSKWPAGFEWDYLSPGKCALGLWRQTFKNDHVGYPANIGLSSVRYDRIFFGAWARVDKPMSEVTPEHIADLLEAV